MGHFIPLSTSDPTAYSTLLWVVQHQNIIGWQLFIKGYTSDYWKSVFQCLQDPNMSGDSQHWTVSLVSACLVLCKTIWTDRNTVIHVASRSEAQNFLHKRLIDQVYKIYSRPPKLHKCFPQIQAVSLQDRIKCSNTFAMMAFIHQTSEMGI